MGDLGSDTGNATLSLGAKILEAILRLFEKVYEAWKNHPERELAKYKLKEAKVDLERQKILDRLDGKTGFVNYQDLKRSGQELKPLGIFMTKTEMKEFSALCKREGVQFSGMTDSTEKNSDGVKAYEIICKKNDLEKVANIVDRLNDEKMIIGIDNRIAELEAKGENMTMQDKVDIEALKEQKATIQKSYCEKLNDEMSRNVIDRAVTGEEKQNLTLDEALNRLTGRHIDKDIVCIVADANDPSKYIKCHGYQDTYKDEAYIKTEYEVFRGGQSVLKTHDGRFDNRPKDYWNEQKAAIQEAGEFSGTFFKFQSVVEYQKWAEAVRSQNTQELTSMEKEGEKDFDAIIRDLNSQLDRNGAKIQDGKVVNKETGEPLAIAEGMTAEEQASVAEAMVIGKQINNYEEMSKVNTEIAIAQADVLSTEEGSEARVSAEQKLSEVENKYKVFEDKENALLIERKNINAVQAEQDVRNAPEKDKVLDNDMNLDKAKGLSELKDKAPVLTTVDAEAHPDDRRTDRIIEKDEKQMSMEEAKGQIEQARAKDGAKMNDVKDRQVQDQGAKSAITKSTKIQKER